MLWPKRKAASENSMGMEKLDPRFRGVRAC